MKPKARHVGRAAFDPFNCQCEIRGCDRWSGGETANGSGIKDALLSYLFGARQAPCLRGHSAEVNGQSSA